MRNVRIVQDSRSQLALPEDSSVDQFAYSSVSNDFLILINDFTIISVGKWLVNLQDAVPDISAAKITHLSCILDIDALCVTTSAGHLITVDVHTQDVQEVGSLEGGIVAAEWSPDGELFAIITGAAVLLIFNKDFDVVNEMSLHSWPAKVVPMRPLPEVETLQQCTAASISWRGDGQYFVTVTKESADKDSLLRVWERESCGIYAIGEAVPGLIGPVAWQPNGRHIYAVHRTEEGLSVSLYEKNALAHGSFSLRTNGSVKDLSWSQDSELLAISLEDPAKQGPCIQIWLRSNWKWYLKQELLYSSSKGIQMQWDEEYGSRLNVVLAEGTRQMIEFDRCVNVSEAGTVAVIDGHDLLLTPLQDSIIPPPMCAMRAHFSAPVRCVAFLDGPQEMLVATLSDGSLGVVRILDDEVEPQDLTHYANGTHSKDENSSFEEDVDILQPRMLADVNASSRLMLQNARILLASQTGLIVAFGASRAPGTPLTGYDHQDQRIELQLADLQASDTDILSGQPIVGLPEGVAIACLGQGQPIIQHNDGSISHHLDNATPPSGCPRFVQLLECPDEAAGSLLGLTSQGDIYCDDVKVASGVTSMLIRRGTDGSPHYLLYTTKDKFLHTSPLATLTAIDATVDAPEEMMTYNRGIGEGRRRDNHYVDMHTAMRGHGMSVPSGNILKARAVEKGALLVAAPPGDVMVVLQMPRGNLEAVYPRSLVLPAVADLVQRLRYGEAFQLAIAHRVDLNLIVDYGWPRFPANAARFVEQVNDDQDLGDLLAALREQNITAEGGLYAGLPPAEAFLPSIESSQDDGSASKEKISQVCDALRGAMLAEDASLFLKPIVASYAIQGRLEDALQTIKDTKEEQLQRETSHHEASTSGRDGFAGQGMLGKQRKKSQRRPPSAEDALIYLLLTVDVEKLYRTALGMYELELAYMVVVHSQRDPGEYLIELKKLSANPRGPLREYDINIHLGRISHAMINLLDAGDDYFPQALALAIKEGKIRELLKLVESRSPDVEKRREVLNAYARWLSDREKKEDAAVAYLAAANLEAALLEYKSGNHWSMTLSLAARLGHSQQQVRSLAEELVESLSASSQWGEAAAVSAQYLKDPDTTVSLLSQAHQWREALRVAGLFQRDDLLDTIAVPAAADTAASLLEEFADSIERIGKYSRRLKDIRSKRQAMAALVEANGDDLREDETGSEVASTLVSGMSAYTQGDRSQTTGTHSSAGVPSTVGGRLPQKRVRRKKGPRIRQGSPQEEEALVSHIASLAPSKDRLKEVGELNEFLVLLGHESDAKKLQSLLSDVILKQSEAALEAQSSVSADSTGVAHPAAAKQAGKQAGKPQSLPEQIVDWKWDILRNL